MLGMTIGLVVQLCVLAPARAAECTRKVDDVQSPAAALEEPVVLSPAEGSQQRIFKFGSDRGTKQIKNVRVESDKRLPASVTPEQINFEALIERSGDTLESADFPDPTFSNPRIAANRKRLTFTVCLNGNGVKSGKYVGSVTVSGPEGLGEARVGITANLKASRLMWLLFTALALLIAGVALYWKASGDGTTMDKKWWFKTVAALGAAFVALAAAYSTDPSWGADPLTSALAFIGAGLGAVGGRKLLE